MSRYEGRRAFVMDSGALTTLAANDALRLAWLEEFTRWKHGVVLIPEIILAETFVGQKASDFRMARLLGAVEDMANPGSLWLPVTKEIFKRAGVLRSDAILAAPRRQAPSVADATVVACAESVSFKMAVTIFTTDPDDLELLVDQTRRTNIAVDAL